MGKDSYPEKIDQIGQQGAELWARGCAPPPLEPKFVFF